MTRIFRTKPFVRFARRERIPDRELCDAVARAEAGLIDADLGGGVIKQRLRREGAGKSGGFRSIILFRRGALAFFVYGFAKNERDNITKDELSTFRKLADEMLALDDPSLVAALKNGDHHRDQDAMTKRYRSAALAAIHETALGLAEAGVMDKRTMKSFDEMCLTPIEDLSAEDIRRIRLREKASQAVFARHLNVTPGLVSQWERGEKRPRGPSLKLLTLVAKKGLDAVA